jgi:hypothetical protein
MPNQKDEEIKVTNKMIHEHIGQLSLELFVLKKRLLDLKSEHERVYEEPKTKVPE